MDPWFVENLVCPRDREALTPDRGYLRCPRSHRYPVVRSVPVMIVNDAPQTLWVAAKSYERAVDYVESGGKEEDVFADTLGISDTEREALLREIDTSSGSIDPVARYLVSATCGYLYKGLVGRLETYPIPSLRLPPGPGCFLDVGCSWGRWSVAAARRGYDVVGIDPSLGAVLAATRISRQLGVQARYLVGDARFLPLKDSIFDVVFSYSVLQHFAKEDCRLALREIGRVLRTGARSTIQMPNAWGVRSFYHQLRRGFGEPAGFDVRYWTPRELEATFTELVGPTRLSVDGFFGLGIQAGDAQLVPPWLRSAVYLSEALRGLTTHLPTLRWLADSVYVESAKSG